MTGSLHDRPTAQELVEAVRDFLEKDVMAATEGRVNFHTRVAVNVLGMVARELALAPEQVTAHERGLGGLGYADDERLATAIREGAIAVDDPALLEFLRQTVRAKLEVANPSYLESPSA